MRLTGGPAAPGAPIEVVLVPESSALAARVPSWVSGYADGPASAVVLIPARAPAYPDDDLGELFGHELAHVLIFRAARGRPVPRWFNEGLAMAAGRSWGLEDRGRVAWELWSGRSASLAELDRRFGQGQAAARSAYALSGAFVRDLLDRSGEDVAARILARVGEGEPFDQAFLRVTGASPVAAEASFARRQNFWQRWLPFLVSSTALWMAITGLALVAARRRRLRSARLRRRWEEEESAALDSETDPDQVAEHSE